MTFKVYVRKGRAANSLIAGQQLWVWKVFCTQQLVEVGFADNLKDYLGCQNTQLRTGNHNNLGVNFIHMHRTVSSI